jgi:AcrR family transcriptional regulator
VSTSAIRPGGRSERVRRSVIAATAEELLESGYEGLSLAKVARRAGVYYMTVYRRWPSKNRLVLDAVIDLTRERVPLPDLGDLRSDLRVYFRTMAEAYAEPRGAAFVRALVEIADDTTFANELREYWQDRFLVAEELVARAVGRGELPSSTEPWGLIELIAGPMWMRLLMTHIPVDEEFLDRAIERAIRAVS